MTDVLLRQEIEKLGGNEEDFKLVKDIEDPEDEEWNPKTTTDQSDDFNLEEFKKFHTSLNFDSVPKVISKPKNSENVKEEPEDGDEDREDEDEEETDMKVEVDSEPVGGLGLVPKEEPVTFVDKNVIKPLMAGIVRKPKPRKKPLLPVGDEAEPWHYSLEELYKKVLIKEDFVPIDPESDFIKALKSKAAALVEMESNIKTKALRDFVKTAADSGTAKDKAAALVLKLTSGAVPNHTAIDQLLNLCKKKVRRNFIMCGSLLRDALLSDILPLNRQLVEFHERSKFLIWSAKNQTHPQSDSGLMLAWFEDKLKTSFSDFVSILESAMNDQVDKSKELSLEIAADLLEKQPECESRLLSILVNKLGDPKSKISQKATFLLLGLLRKHPNMQPIISGEVESLLFRSNQSSASIYSAISFLNQMVFSNDRHEVPTRMLNLYFQFFTSEIQKKSKLMNQKILLGLLTGVNRAFPFAHLENNDSISKNIDQLYKLVHHGTFIVGLQSLSLLYQAFNTKEELSDRFYNAVYSLILRPELITEGKRHPMFLNLIYRVVSNDKHTSRQKAFIKRLLAVSMTAKTPFQAGVLVLFGQIIKEKKLLKGVIEEKLDNKVSSIGGKEFNKKLSEKFGSDDEEEKFLDADKDNKDVKDEPKSAGWDHRKTEDKSYDPWCRNPSYAGSDGSLSWEYSSLSRHFHPSLRKFAENISSDSKEKYPGDPLADFTVIRFLDRFVYKNPKAADDKPRTVNVHKRKRNTHLDSTQLPVTSLEFLQKKTEDLPPHDQFLHRYFRLRSGGGVVGTSKDVDGDDELEEVSDSEFDKLLDEQERGWENKTGKKFDYNYIATPKERKKMKRKNEHKMDSEFQELDDDEPDFDDLYSDQSDHDEGSDDGMDFEFQDDGMEEDEPPPPKKTKKGKKSRILDSDKVTASAEVLGELLDNQPTGKSKQMEWEEKRASNKQGKRFTKSKGTGKHPNKRFRKK